MSDMPKGDWSADFTFRDFRNHLGRIGRLDAHNRPLIPGLRAEDIERGLPRLIGIIDAMTPDERRRSLKINDPGRLGRIARGAGIEQAEVAEFQTQFLAMAAMMKSLPRGDVS
ncbi:MAG TPA: hypothetical protein VGN12_08650 [Pirellulales bacterium]|jgi:signal recognition particle GTPase